MSTNPQMLRLAPPYAVAGARGATQVPLYLAVALFYVMLIPEQANVNLGGVMLSPYRLLLIPTFLYLLSSALKGDFRLAWPDIPITFACAWITLASYVTSNSVTAALVQGGAHLMDIGLPYFVARFAIRTPRDFRAFLVLIAPGVALEGALVFLESISGRIILQSLLSNLTGVPNRVATEVRMGLTRGTASFPHPILAGISLASFVTLYLMSGIRGWPRIVGAIGAVGGFFSMSSAAMLGLVVGTVLLAYDFLVQRIANLSWRLFLFAVSVLYLAVELTSNSGFFNLLVRYASLNTVSGYNRVLIWRYGTENVARNPWFGIGYDDWDRPEWMQWQNSFSVDHFWLLQAMRFGLPTSIMLILATLGAVTMLCIRSMHCAAVDARMLRGLAISLAVFALGAVSVALWLNAMVWFFVLLGIAVSLGMSPMRNVPVRSPAPGFLYPVQRGSRP